MRLISDPKMQMPFKPQLWPFAILASMFAIVLMTAPSSFPASDSSPTTSTSSKVPTGETLNGKATYYPNSLNGHKTSSGKAFHQNGKTAASNRLPLGTHVKVTNLKTGKTTDVEVTDRGSKLGNQKIDLSKRAAREIGLSHKEGKAPVEIEVTRTPNHPTVPSSPP
jgi:rare lipoprotein A (peptidoglycan hydrolase)